MGRQSFSSISTRSTSAPKTCPPSKLRWPRSAPSYDSCHMCMGRLSCQPDQACPQFVYTPRIRHNSSRLAFSPQVCGVWLAFFSHGECTGCHGCSFVTFTAFVSHVVVSETVLFGV